MIGAQLKHMVDVMDEKLDRIELNHMQLTLEEIAPSLKVPAGKPPAKKGPLKAGYAKINWGQASWVEKEQVDANLYEVKCAMICEALDYPDLRRPGGTLVWHND